MRAVARAPSNGQGNIRRICASYNQIRSLAATPPISICQWELPRHQRPARPGSPYSPTGTTASPGNLARVSAGEVNRLIIDHQHPAPPPHIDLHHR